MLGKAETKSKCKGDDTSNILILDVKKIRRVLANSIPVLSIFALVGIISLGVMLPSNNLTRLFGIDKLFGLDSLLEDGDKAYAETYTTADASGNSAVSLTIGGAGETEQVAAGRGNTIYRTHTVTLNANNIESYALTIAGNPNMTNPDGSNTIDTITSTNGNVIGSNLVDNTWGYYYGEYNSTNGNSKETVVYQPVVSTGTTIDSGSPSDHTITNQTKNLVFAAKFGEDIVPGRYYANVNLSMIATPRTITYTLSYNANGGTGTVPSTQTMTTTSDSYEFTVANQGGLTKTGYSFLGWSESSVATSAQYVAGSKITLSSTTPSRVLYAVWEKQAPNVTGFGGIKKMQDMTPIICKSVSIGTSGQLYDTRDNSTYTIKKLNNEQCWMTQNLRLTRESMTTKGTQLSNTNSDITGTPVFTTLPSSSNAGFSSDTTPKVYYSNSTTYGAYYNWYAATAGTGNASLSSGNAESSICPKNWKLPKGNTGTNNDFAIAIGIPSITIAANTSYWDNLSNPSFNDGILSVNNNSWSTAGYCLNNSCTNPGYYGNYWSRTADTSAGAYAFNFTSNSASPANSFVRYFGFSVRCIAYSS